jgi:hypothetical protein
LLRDEQRAMLQLLLEGGQGYDDIGSLLGTAPDEVRSRARDALREMGGADPDAQVGLSDYLLGQADPIGRADAVRHLQSDPDANALAQRLVTQLRLIAPKADLPEIPAAKGGRRAAAPPPPPTAAPAESAPSEPPTGPAPGAPAGPGFATRVAGVFRGGGRRAQLAVAGVAALALIVAVAVVASGSSDDDGGGGDGCNTVDTSQAQEAGVPAITLNAVGPGAEADCPPSGQMTLAPVQAQGQNQNQSQGGFAFQANAADLEPTTEGEVYVLWLYNSDDQAFPLGQQTVDANGNLTGGVPLTPQEVLLLTAFQSVRLSRVSSTEAQQIQQTLQQAQRQQQQGQQTGQPVTFVGEPALEGDVAELGLDELLQQAQGQAGGGQGQAPQGQGAQGAQGGASQ